MEGYRTVKVRYNYDEDDIQIIETMFAGIFRRSVLSDSNLECERIDNCAKFLAQFADNIFQDEYAILYELAVTRKLTTGSWDMLEAVINENKELILSAPQVNLAKFAADFTESDEYDAFISIAKAVYERVCDAEFTGSEGFRSSLNNFVEVFLKKYMRKCLSVAGAILNDPYTFTDNRGGRRRVYEGYDGALEFLAVEKAKIDSLRGAQRVRQFVLDSEWLCEQLDPELSLEREKRTELLCTINIPTIDNIWSGLRRTHMIGIIGPPKGGKTTLSAYMVYCLLKAGKRVAVWAMEGSANESWINKLIAAHCSEAGYNITTKDLSDGLVGKTEEELSAVTDARITLTQDGKLSFIEETGYVEDFLDVIDGHYRAYNNFDAIVIDSLINLQSRTGRRKTEYLSSAYMLLKDYVEHRLEVPPVCIATAQFKQEAIKDAHNMVDFTFDETSGGETAETIRTPDDVIGIFGTQGQKEVNQTTLFHIASRHSQLFNKIEVKALFGSALFYSDK